MWAVEFTSKVRLGTRVTGDSSFGSQKRGIATARWIGDFNEVLTSHPALSLTTFLAMRSSFWYALTALYAYQGLFPGSELAIGYILAKFTGKIRQPANLALAAFLCRAFPILTLIKSRPLVGMIYPTNETSDSSTESSSSTQPNSKQPPSKQPPSWSQHLAEMVESTIVGPVDTYGFALYLAGKINVAVTIVAAALCIRYGIDANSILSSFGISETLQSGGSAMGAATVTNVFLLPLHLRIFPELVTKVAREVTRYEQGQR